MLIIKKEGVNEKGFVQMFDAAVILPAENFKRYATPEKALVYAKWILDVTPHGWDPEARKMAHRIIAAVHK